MPVSLHQILPLALFRFFKLPLQVGHALALALSLWIIVADLPTLRLLVRLVLTQELPLEPHITVRALAMHVMLNASTTGFLALSRFLLHLPLALFLFPLPLLLLHAPLLLFSLSLCFLLPSSLLLCTRSLLFCLTLDSPFLLCLSRQLLSPRIFLFFLPALPLLLC